MNTAIRIQDITKTYGDKIIISIDKLNFEKGKIYGLLGKNGVGKTTLFKIITGLKSPSTGTVTILGKIQDKEKKDYLKQLGINIDSPRFYQHLSAVDNLTLHLQLMGAEAYIKDIKTILTKVGLDAENNLPVSKYSLGMKQRLAIARAIIHAPEILILDEPMNGLDPTGAKEVRELLLQLAKESGTTVLISSHIISDIVQFVDEIIVMANGRIYLDETMESLKNTYGEQVEYEIIRKMEGN